MNADTINIELNIPAEAAVLFVLGSNVAYDAAGNEYRADGMDEEKRCVLGAILIGYLEHNQHNKLAEQCRQTFAGLYPGRFLPEKEQYAQARR
jgi:hypothetical protein